MQNGCTRSWQLTIGLISFLVGIFSALKTGDFLWQTAISFSLGGIILFLFNKASKLEQLAFGFFICLLSFWIGIFSVGWQEPSEQSVKFLPNTTVSISGRVRSVQDRGDRAQIVLEEIKYGEEDRLGNILVFTDSVWTVGERVEIACRLADAEPFNGFRYDLFLEAREVRKVCFASGERRVIGHELTIRSVFYEMRNDVVGGFRKRFSEPHATLMAGLLLGDVWFSESWQMIFARTGISHIVAASGYNVTLVSSILFGLLTWVGLRRRQAFFILLAGIVAYMFLAGLSAPVVRAGIMGGLVLLSRQIGRKTTMRNIVLLTVVAMVAVNPVVLIADVGFQLSVLSTIGLIWLAPRLSSYFKFLPETLAIRESVVSTLAATLATLPIVVISFGQVSLISPIANFLILPVIPFLTGFSVLALLVNQASILIGPAWLLAEYIFMVAAELSELPFAILTLDYKDRDFVLLSIFSIIALCYLIWWKKD
jgi:competence protein ComEC